MVKICQLFFSLPELIQRWNAIFAGVGGGGGGGGGFGLPAAITDVPLGPPLLPQPHSVTTNAKTHNSASIAPVRLICLDLPMPVLSPAEP
jgi:hypothetical protein